MVLKNRSAQQDVLLMYKIIHGIIDVDVSGNDGYRVPYIEGYICQCIDSIGEIH